MAEKHDFTKMFMNAEIKHISNLQAELLLCPFCGSTDILMRDARGMLGKSAYERTYHYMQCRKCFSQTGLYGTKPRTIKAWNTRTKERGGEK